MAALFCLGNRAIGEGSVTELVFESRFRYIEELRRMGAAVTVQDRCAYIKPSVLHAKKLRSPDLRGGAALLLAALATNGQSEITNAVTIGRGYEHLEAKLRALGAKITVF
jgi:UDP-N-acetylglucosamine 1-carboxyvinyltransferase